MVEREGLSVCGGVSQTNPINEEGSPEKTGEKSPEEQDLLERNVKKLNNDVDMEVNSPHDNQEGDEQMEDAKQEELGGARNSYQNKHHANFKRTQISYKSKLMGKEEKTFSKELDEAMREWLKEEEETAPALTEEQKNLFGTLPSLPMTDERLKELCMPWKDAVIVTLLGKMANLDKMKDRIAWLIKDNRFELVDLPNNFYVFRSENKELCRRLLFDGPWLIQGHYLAVQRWSPNFNPYCNKFRKVAVWVRVPTLPMHVYSEQCMLEIGNIIGKALKVDINTLAQCHNNNIAVERGKYARVSVEVDLNQPLKSRFVIRRKIYTVEYEGLDLICFNCGRYGHKQENCLMKPEEENQGDEAETRKQPRNINEDASSPSQNRQPIFSVPGVKEEEEYGSWMKAKNTFRPRKLKSPEMENVVPPKMQSGGKQKEKTARSTLGTRFDVLQFQEKSVPSNGPMPEQSSKSVSKEWRKKGVSPNKVVDVTCEPLVTASFSSVQGEGSSSKDMNMTFAAVKGDETSAGFKREKEKKTRVGKKKGDVGNGLGPKGSGPNEGSEVDIEKLKEVLGRKLPSPVERRVPIAQEIVTAHSKKRQVNSRPIIISPILKRKNATRTHQIIVGSSIHKGPLNFDKITVPRGASQMEGSRTSESRPSLEVISDLANSSSLKEDASAPSMKPPDASALGDNYEIMPGNQEHGDLWYETQAEVKDDSESDSGEMDTVDATT